MIEQRLEKERASPAPTPPFHFGELNEDVPQLKGFKGWRSRFAAGKLPGFLIVVALNIGVAAACWRLPTLSSLAVAFTLYTISLYQNFSHRQSPRYLSRLLDLPCMHGTFPMKVEVAYGTVTCWRDEGIVTIHNGYLHFEGVRSSFGLRSQDFQRSGGAKSGETSIAEVLPRHVCIFQRSVVPQIKDCRVSFYPYDSLPELGNGLRKEFVKSMKDWQEMRSDDVAYSTFPQIKVDRKTPWIRTELAIWWLGTYAIFAFVCLVHVIPFLTTYLGLSLGISIIADLNSLAASFRLSAIREERQWVDRLRQSLETSDGAALLAERMKA